MAAELALGSFTVIIEFLKGSFWGKAWHWLLNCFEGVESPQMG
jgi:hypothetical protein